MIVSGALLLAALAFAQNGLVDDDGDGCPVESEACSDCDDADENARPGNEETCFDGADNNCDGFVDEACDQGVLQGQLSGGGGCTGGGSVAAMALIWPRRRRT